MEIFGYNDIVKKSKYYIFLGSSKLGEVAIKDIYVHLWASKIQAHFLNLILTSVK